MRLPTVLSVVLRCRRAPAADSLRDSGGAATAAAFAVKFMLIESEAAATSASFQPAQFSPLPPTESTLSDGLNNHGEQNVHSPVP